MRPDKRSPERDPAYLLDMLTAGRAVVSFVTGKTREDYANDLMLRSAVERQVEIMGEAARNVSEQTKAANPQVPWQAIQGQRHRLAHEYGSIREDALWRVATIHIPNLIPILERLAPA